ncbi:uncharacterized protein LOC113870066 [Abrus precatorius]|uniref:Uncharacterized protein LOC113870066 n=1 Tax=Abrus precatorius TaxID=3816 RepID=A0A8B8M1R6_ABRPR|nr:uncharacterized protein LOC113870066 [Abrus precatorius]
MHYGFNPLTLLDLVPLSTSNDIMHRDGKAKAEYVQSLHERVRAQITKKNEHYARLANKRRCEVSLDIGDWVWLHLKKERFPSQRKSKLSSRGDGPFQIVEKINNNAYKLDLSSEYGVIATCNICDLCPYFADDREDDDGLDLRTNPLEEGGHDEDLTSL